MSVLLFAYENKVKNITLTFWNIQDVNREKVVG